LAAVLHQPSPQEFQAQLDDPFYEPADRSIVKDRDQIAGHLRQTWRTMRFGPARWSFGRLSYLAVLPEFRSQAVAERLLRFGEARLLAGGALMAELQTADSDTARRAGWSPCSGCVFSEASPRDILSQLAWRREQSGSEVLAAVRRRSKRFSVRHWRHVELPAVMRIYRANLNACHGALDRSEEYWRWLIGRRAFDYISVAIEGRDRLALDERASRIVGYAVVKDHHILELFTEPGHPNAAVGLLARICADAIERDQHTIRLHGPADHPLHDCIQEADGGYHVCRSPRGSGNFVKILQPEKLVAHLAAEWKDRIQAAPVQLPVELPVELGMLVEGQKWHLTLGADGAKMVKGKLGRSYVACDAATWTGLLLSYLDAATAMAAGRLTPSTTLASLVAQTLFSRTLMWRPPWDHLPA
jgi:ribosomal protein S18 acetylase RimI-like enzyme